MKQLFTIALTATLLLLASATDLSAQKADELKYTDAKELMLINKGFENTQYDYSRLPLDIKENTRQAVWDLGLNSAGLAIRFSSDSKCIGARYTLLNNFRMNHMATAGICGLDLYILNDKGQWCFLANIRPGSDKKVEGIFTRNGKGEMRDYMVYLPLYDGVTELAIGVDSTAFIGAPKSAKLTSDKGKPILFYGTSITQGGCASRPGMVYTSIISRKLDKECINLGFSGNARMDKSMAHAISRVDAEQYVLDCLPNCTAQILRDSAEYFVRYLADAHPSTPIFMVENIYYAYQTVDTKTESDFIEKNNVWKELYKRLRKEGYRNLKYIPQEKISDGMLEEGTVDGTHRTDLGFQKMADAFMKFIK